MKELNNIPGLKPEDIVKIKKLSYGEKSKLSSKCIELDWKTQQPKFDISLYRIYVLVYGIVEAPFDLKPESIESLDASVGEYLFSEILNYNNMGDGSTELQKK